MEIGICTSKVIKDIKPKNKVDGRFFHTSDTDEWYFCWKGELQKLNLKGDSDVNAALDEVKKLIGEANAAVEVAKSTAKEAQQAATDAKNAADAAGAAIETIENKADKSEVESLAKVVEDKANTSVVNALSQKVDAIEDDFATKDEVKTLSDKVDAIKVPSMDDFATKNEVNALSDKVDASIENYYTKEDIDGKLSTISGLIGQAEAITNTILA
jgi:hypothetical protein